jgi:hypothetical protein
LGHREGFGMGDNSVQDGGDEAHDDVVGDGGAGGSKTGDVKAGAGNLVIDRAAGDSYSTGGRAGTAASSGAAAAKTSA